MLSGASVVLEALRDLWGPGLVFLVLCVWLVRRALRAARNESILEEQRLRATFGELVEEASSGPPVEAPEKPVPAEEKRVPPRLAGADVRTALPEHLDAVGRIIAEREGAATARRSEVLWVRSTGTHVAWCERRPGQHELICVAQIDGGKVVARWQFG
jgi:hypothetical protein